MRVRICFEWPDGSEDSVILSGVDVEEIKLKAKQFTDERGIDQLSCYAEEV